MTIRRVALMTALMVAPMMAQWGRTANRGYDDRGYRDNDRYESGRRGGSGIGAVERAMQNLRSASSRAYRLDGHERKHFERAMSDLDRFRDNWQRSGSFDRGRLDSAISNMADLARADRVNPRDRALIGRDVNMLRDFRNGGGNGNNPDRW